MYDRRVCVKLNADAVKPFRKAVKQAQCAIVSFGERWRPHCKSTREQAAEFLICHAQ